MAPREIKAEDCPSEFTSIGELFPKVGSKFTALFEKVEAGQYGADYSWQTKSGAVTKFTAKGLLEKMLAKAKLTPGEKVTITMTAEIPPTKEGYSAKRVFGLSVDDSTVKGFKTAIVEEEPEQQDESDSDESGEDPAW